MSGSWQIPQFADKIGDAFDWWAVPAPCGAAACTGMPGGAALVAMKDTKHPAEVGKLMDFLAQEESLAEFYEQQGGDKQTFIDAFNSIEVASELSRADGMARRMKVAMVPSIVIQGKYLVRTSGSVGPNRMLEVMDYLLAMIE